MNETKQLEQAIQALESQRAALGDRIVDMALAPLLEKLAGLRQAGQPAEETRQAEAQSGGARLTEERRKLVTVLFTDLVGFTALAETMDPEDVREILNAYFTRWTTCIQQYGGVVEKFIGDAVMAVFGLETAQENDPERAIRAALEMQSALEELNAELEGQRGVQLAMRVGIHTGQAVVSLLGERERRSDGQDFVVVGDTVNLASRIQSLAPPNGVLISHETYRHVRGVFIVQAQEPVRVKGRTDPVQVYQILSAKPRAFRITERSIEGIETRMVGRSAELKALLDALEKMVRDREAQHVTVVGEAGVGKSRLIYEFEKAAELLPTVLRLYKGRASPYLQKQSYALMRDLFSFRFQIHDSDPPGIVREKMEQGIGEVVPAHFIGQLFGFDFSDSPHLPQAGQAEASSAEQARQLRDQALAYLSQYFKNQARERPVIILLEDMHWADESSLDLIQYLEGEFRDQPLMIACAARPALLERRPEWSQDTPAHTLLYLRRLSEQDSRRLVDEILQKVEDVPDTLRSLLVNNAEGNPYYLEELVKILIEDGIIRKGAEQWHIDPSRLAGLRVPPTLTGVLQARFDSLSSPERQVLQQAAVIGKTFWDQAVVFVQGRPAAERAAQEANLANTLERLRRREIIFQRSKSAFEGCQEYIFRHSLLRDVVYESVLRRVRREYHARAAQWMEQITEQSRRTDEYAALIAGHYEQADEFPTAARWYRRAGEQAAARFANHEAIHNLNHALELLPPEEAEGRYAALLAREKIYDRQGNRASQQQDLEALAALAEALDDDARRAEIQVQKASLFFMTGDYATAISAAQQAIPLAQAGGRVDREAAANVLWGRSLAWIGEHEAAAGRLKQALSLARAAGLVGLEADTLWNLAIVFSNQSEYAPAHEYLQQALALYRQTGDISGESVVLGQIGAVYLHQGNHAGARQYMEAALHLYRQIGHRFRESIVLNNLGILAYEQGRYADARRMYEESLQIELEIGDKYGIASSQTNLADVLRDTGCYEEARAGYEAALELCFELGDRMLECAVRANLCLLHVHLDDLETALEYGRQSLETAQELNIPVYGVQALSRYARAQWAGSQADEAAQTYRDTLDLAEKLGLESRAMEARAGLAGIALERSRLPQAQALVETILVHLEKKDLHGADEPGWIYLTCYRVLQAGRDPRALPTLETGCQLMLKQADGLDEEWRHSYLHNVAVHRELLKEWKQAR